MLIIISSSSSSSMFISSSSSSSSSSKTSAGGDHAGAPSECPPDGFTNNYWQPRQLRRALQREVFIATLGIHQRGVQSEGGAVDGGSVM